MLGQGAYAKVQGCISLQNGQEFAVKVSNDDLQVSHATKSNKVRHLKRKFCIQLAG